MAASAAQLHITQQLMVRPAGRGQREVMTAYWIARAPWHQQTPVPVRWRIVSLKKRRPLLSNRAIAGMVACDPSTVAFWWERHRRTGTVASRTGQGQKPVLSGPKRAGVVRSLEAGKPSGHLAAVHQGKRGVRVEELHVPQRQFWAAIGLGWSTVLVPCDRVTASSYAVVLTKHILPALRRQPLLQFQQVTQHIVERAPHNASGSTQCRPAYALCGWVLRSRSGIIQWMSSV